MLPCFASSLNASPMPLLSHPLFVLCPRVHTVKYNRFHDQLLISGSSDCMVHLWRVSSVSSAPLLEPEDDDTEGLDGDGVGVGFGISNGSKGEAADIRVSASHDMQECRRVQGPRAETTD